MYIPKRSPFWGLSSDLEISSTFIFVPSFSHSTCPFSIFFTYMSMPSHGETITDESPREVLGGSLKNQMFFSSAGKENLGQSAPQ